MDHMESGRVIALLRLSAEPERPYTWLYTQAAQHLATHGLDAVRGWLYGYWSASGTRHYGSHGAVVLIRDIVGAGNWHQLAVLSDPTPWKGDSNAS